MATRLVECIPNFSEGRRPEVVAEIVGAITAVEGVILLDQSSDADHNRSVVTFVGPPEAVEAAAFAGIAKAAELINLDEHQGAHPRIGAADVVPFVPISGVEIADCVEIARRVGKRVGEELAIAVYLYEKAATRPERENLAKVRQGEYELWKEEIGKNPEREPDFGPAKPNPAGATVIGARSPLIAYNVYLNTGDVTIAEKIGKAVRHLSGGLRFVKGLGLLVDGKAQVSMNLTNYKRTPVYRVVEMIRREAARYGASITHSELIGLIPQQALLDAAAWYLQLDDFDMDQVLENRIQAAQGGDKAGPQVDDSFLDALASGTPTPGGGSAAAYSAAMGAGLAAMVARLTVNKKKYKDIEEEMFAVIESADGLRADLTAMVDKDAQAYLEVMAAFKLPKGSEEEQAARAKAVQQATLGAAEVPLDTARKAVEVMRLALTVASKGNPNAVTDGATAAALAQASLSAAGMNVRINLTTLEDKQTAGKMLQELDSLDKEAAGLGEKVAAAAKERGGF
ncbi:MAG: glutamate formimidoyltransferase [Anaerolineae bacterium]|nr:glutamate formimidoyltransferase [Anaerolineae bacterium]